MDEYSPFEKKIDNLVAADLEGLKFCQEGWYIEYKSEVPSSESIAKTLSAFANTYGGWAFYGIKEKSKDESVAGEFLGIPTKDADAALQKIRQAAAMHINPTVYFSVKSIAGPCEAIGLAADRAVICINVPSSINTPHIHKSGRIYRRVGDGSEPFPENDRHSLDRLWDRSNKVVDAFKAWHDDDPELTAKEVTIPYFRLMLVPSLWRRKPLNAGLEINKVREFFKSSNNVNLGSVHTTADGFVARQTQGNDPSAMVFTWFLRYDLSSDIIVPLNIIQPFDSKSKHLSEYKYITEYREVLHDAEYRHAKVVDLNFLYICIYNVVEAYLKLLAEYGLESDFYVKTKILNCHRVTPFIDVKHCIDDMRNNGIPVCYSRNSTSLPGTHPDSFLHAKVESEILASYSVETAIKFELEAISQLIFMLAANAFGFPSHFDTEESEPEHYSQFKEAASRGHKVQDKRNGNSF